MNSRLWAVFAPFGSFLHWIYQLFVTFLWLGVIFLTFGQFWQSFFNVKLFFCTWLFFVRFLKLLWRFLSLIYFWRDFEIKISQNGCKKMNKNAKKNEKVVADLVCFLSLIYICSDFLVLWNENFTKWMQKNG